MADGETPESGEGGVTHEWLDRLLLDKDNPRFGLQDRTRVNQTEIVDYIVTTFGVDDVLSSLAVNGYFAAEPLVCRPEPGTDKLIVAEGNRRLAACLILTGDDRARNHRPRTEHFHAVHEAHGSPTVNPVPVIVFSEDDHQRSLLSYLGVRHIASAQPWDSYAKAVWIARVVETGMDTADVATMIGDQHRTVARLLEGYHFIRQLEQEGRFHAENSVRKGRGSNTAYPFSWVYTILGYNSVRTFLEIDEDPRAEQPIPAQKLDDAAVITRAMFGDKAKGLNSAIDDSRQLGELATIVASPEKMTLLKQGKSLRDISKITQPLEERLASGLMEARDALSDINTRLTEQEVPAAVAGKFTESSAKVKRLATQVDRQLQEASSGDGE
ncbi:MAG: hypothetical protein JJU06_13290 [Ectothiorhodospiraceae bacterium]|nr:hypothetical protein [Ectothiorhodospiraceae bacterium]